MKKIYKSKTFWVNLIALVALLLQLEYGLVVSAELQLTVLGLVNVVLRLVTKEQIEFE